MSYYARISSSYAPTPRQLIRLQDPFHSKASVHSIKAHHHNQHLHFYYHRYHQDITASTTTKQQQLKYQQKQQEAYEPESAEAELEPQRFGFEQLEQPSRNMSIDFL